MPLLSIHRSRLQALPSRIEQMLSQDKRIEALAEDFL